MEDAVASHGLQCMESNQSTHVPLDVHSPEDVAWADSCLANDLEISRNGWDSWSSLNDALNQVTSSKGDPSPARWEDLSSSSREIGTSQILDARVDGFFVLDEEADKYSGDQLINDNTDPSTARFNLKNVFRPTYSEDLRDWGSNDFEELDDLGLGEEQALEDIFKVWNLDIPAEDDEFIKQLNKAFTESSLEHTSPISDDSKLHRGSENESIDDVICGMADLSLNRVNI